MSAYSYDLLKKLHPSYSPQIAGNSGHERAGVDAGGVAGPEWEWERGWARGWARGRPREWAREWARAGAREWAWEWAQARIERNQQ